MISWTLLYLCILLLSVAGTLFDETGAPLLYRKGVLFLLFSCMVFFAGFRSQIGNDYDSYRSLYEEIGHHTFSTYVEPGFALVVKFLNLIGADYQAMFFLFAALTYFLIIKTVSTYSSNPYLAILLFMLLPNYFFNSLSIVRQFFALGVVFYSVKYIIDRQFFKFLACTLLACLFHKTAILILPFYFLAHIRINKYLLTGLLVFAIVFPLTDFLPLLISNVLLADYEMYLHGEPPEFGQGITLVVRVILFFIVLILKDRQQSKAGMTISHLYLLGVIVYFLTLGSEALSRMSLYLMIFEIIAVANIIYLFRKKDAIILSATYALYCSLLYYSNLAGYSKYYFPYTSEGNIQYTFNFKLIK